MIRWKECRSLDDLQDLVIDRRNRKIAVYLVAPNRLSEAMVLGVNRCSYLWVEQPNGQEEMSGQSSPATTTSGG